MDHPVVAKGLAGFRVKWSIPPRRAETGCGPSRPRRPYGTPAWPCAASWTPASTGPPCDAPRRSLASGEGNPVRGDWIVYRPHLEPSGWAFEFDNVHYPDIGDSAIIAAELAATTMEDKIGQKARQGAIGRAVKWQAGTQSSNGAGPPSTGTVNPGSYRKFPAQDSGNPWTRQASM